jgi:chemotaxis protein MotA
MNFSSLLGIIAALAVLIGACFTSTSNRGIFLDPHGILIVFGGTAAASLMCFPLSTYFSTMKVFIRKFLGSYSTRYDTVIMEIVDLAKGVRDNPEYLKTKANALKTDFLRDAVQLLTQGGVSDHALDSILQKRALTHFKRNEDDATVFKTIAKFPPAFGLMGTTLGMIALLQQLGGEDAYKLLGPAMAIGLVATFYGIVMANLVLIPIGENLSKLNKEDEVVREIVMDGIKLIRSREHPLVVEEHLKSYLMPKERAKLKTLRK